MYAPTQNTKAHPQAGTGTHFPFSTTSLGTPEEMQMGLTGSQLLSASLSLSCKSKHKEKKDELL